MLTLLGGFAQVSGDGCRRGLSAQALHRLEDVAPHSGTRELVGIVAEQSPHIQRGIPFQRQLFALVEVTPSDMERATTLAPPPIQSGRGIGDPALSDRAEQIIHGVGIVALRPMAKMALQAQLGENLR